MTQGELLARMAAELERASIPYMVVGSLASSFHGEPRMTRDIDLVIDPTAVALQDLVNHLSGTGLYVDAAAAAEALKRRSSFNAIDPDTGWKVDFLIRKDRPFSRVELDRRISTSLAETIVNIATAEDTIIAKLEWAAMGESERQLRDVASVLAVNAERLDFAYIEAWVHELRLSAMWKIVQEMAAR